MRFPLAAITDEFSPDINRALEAMAELGMTGAELRVVSGTNVLDLSDDELDRIRVQTTSRGISIVSIASPVLKCELPDAPPIDSRFQQDVFGMPHTFADQPRLAKRALEVADRTGARIIRVFSYWRTVDPDRCFDRIVDALGELAEQAASRDLIIGLENEHACNVSTGADAARVLDAIDHPNLRVVWDPANALVAGEAAYPNGYESLPIDRVIHVHAKDCRLKDHAPVWGPIGEMDVGWKDQLAALSRDGYRGFISLETHWKGPNGDKFEASRICATKLRELVS